MFCPKCGKINPDNQEKCSGCNGLLHEETTACTPKKNGKVLKVIFALIAVLIIIGIVVFLLNGCVGTVPEEKMTF
ncbi:MAG: hypothetical protein IJZ81_04210 [Clostridia bacterium]|nr:hypothetical protein [Clostridia bacterium]